MCFLHFNDRVMDRIFEIVLIHAVIVQHAHSIGTKLLHTFVRFELTIMKVGDAPAGQNDKSQLGSGDILPGQAMPHCRMGGGTCQLILIQYSSNIPIIQRWVIMCIPNWYRDKYDFSVMLWV